MIKQTYSHLNPCAAVRTTALLTASLAFLPSLVAQTSGNSDSRRPEGNRTAVVLYVNNSPISEAQFQAKRALVSEQQKTIQYQVEPTQEDLDAEAIALAVEEKLLLEEASSRGISFSDDDITRRIQSMMDEVNASGDEQAKQVFQWAVSQRGLSLEEFKADSQVLDAYRRAFMLGEIRSQIATAAAAAHPADQAAGRAAIKDFLQAHTVDVRAVDPTLSAAAAIARGRLTLR